MDIFVTIGATEALPVIDEVLWLELIRLLVTIGARNRDVPTRQHESSLLVFGQRKGRGLVSFQVVALVAGIQVRGRGKLTGMAVLVAIRAEVKFHPVQRVFALRNVALCAFHTCVPALQRILRRGVLLNREKGWLPPFHVMAGGTLAGIGTLGELAVVGVLVAIRTLRERDCLLEVAIGMALPAADLRMLAFERVLRLGVIEPLRNRLK